MDAMGLGLKAMLLPPLVAPPPLGSLVSLLPLVPLAVLVVSDFRERRIGVAWLAVLGACTVAVAILAGPAGFIHSPADPANSAGALMVSGALGALHNFLFNFGLMVGLAVALLLYFAVRRGLRRESRAPLLGTDLRVERCGELCPERSGGGRWTGHLGAPLREQMGAGDPLFFLALTPLFAPRVFLQLVIACLAISLLWWLFNRGKTIPLVGTSGSVVATYLIYVYIRPYIIYGTL